MSDNDEEINIKMEDDGGGDDDSKSQTGGTVTKSNDMGVVNEELDYNDEDNDNAVDDDMEVNVKITTKNRDKREKTRINEYDDGELSTGSEDGEWSEKDSQKSDKKISKSIEEEKESGEVEDGEIDDGEKTQRVFVPRIPCKYYQRGKCNWGRSCKFLHPGVNDTGNYNFLDVDNDPIARFLPSRGGGSNQATTTTAAAAAAAAYPPTATETAWERGQRFAREMKEKALRRKQTEKDFNEKKMNLSLKELEDEKENDERHFNAERAPRNDLEEDDLGLVDRSELERIKREKAPQQQQQQPQVARRDTSNGAQDRTKKKPQPSVPERQGRPDEWHDYWDRGRQQTKKPQAVQNQTGSRDKIVRSYSRSSSSSSRSSHSSYSSKSHSSRSSSRSSYSSRSASRSPVSKKRVPKAAAPKGVVTKKPTKAATTSSKILPGRQVSDSALKKAVADSDKSKRKNDRSRGMSSASSGSNRSRSGSSSSYSSNSSALSKSSGSASSYSSSDSENGKPKNKSKSGKAKASTSGVGAKSDKVKEELKKSLASLKNTALKRQASDAKTGHDAKKQRVSPSHKKSTTKTGGAKQKDVEEIKAQLKLVESALNKKKAMAK